MQKRPGVPSPAQMFPPAYPPRAQGDGVVIVEVQVDATGGIGETRIVQSASAFDQAALAAVRQWRFQPAQRAGTAVAAYVYIIFGFRQPVTEAAGDRLQTTGGQ
jgi:protein TonB